MDAIAPALQSKRSRAAFPRTRQMEQPQSALDKHALPQTALESTAGASPPKRPKLSHQEPAPTIPGAPPRTADNGVTGLHDPALTRAQVDYWRWKYDEVSQQLTAAMPPGLLKSKPTAAGNSGPRGAWGPHPGINEDMELAYEINLEMGMIPRATSRGLGGARGPRSDHGADSLGSTPSSGLSGEECGVRPADTLLRSPSTSVAGSVWGGTDTDAVIDGIHDLGVSLQRQAKEQLDLIQMPPPG